MNGQRRRRRTEEKKEDFLAIYGSHDKLHWWFPNKKTLFGNEKDGLTRTMQIGKEGGREGRREGKRVCV